jgi:hypothetical protein
VFEQVQDSNFKQHIEVLLPSLSALYTNKTKLTQGSYDIQFFNQTRAEFGKVESTPYREFILEFERIELQVTVPNGEEAN